VLLVHQAVTGYGASIIVSCGAATGVFRGADFFAATLRLAGFAAFFFAGFLFLAFADFFAALRFFGMGAPS
jgi:hypothetical protein